MKKEWNHGVMTEVGMVNLIFTLEDKIDSQGAEIAELQKNNLANCLDKMNLYLSDTEVAWTDAWDAEDICLGTPSDIWVTVKTGDGEDDVEPHSLKTLQTLGSYALHDYKA